MKAHSIICHDRLGTHTHTRKHAQMRETDTKPRCVAQTLETRAANGGGGGGRGGTSREAAIALERKAKRPIFPG